jgi:YcxB-like protein
MIIRGELTSTDFVQFQKYYYYRKKLKVRLLIVLIFAFILPAAFDYDSFKNVYDYLISVLIHGTIFGVVFMGLGYLSLSLTKRMPSKNGSVIGQKIYQILDEGFKEETDNSVNLVKWTGIKSIEQNSKYIFIFIDKIAAYIIPKRFFKTNEELIRFTKLIENRITPHNLV